MFVRCVTEQMLTYALGRGLEPYDRRVVNAIVKPWARRTTGSPPPDRNRQERPVPEANHSRRVAVKNAVMSRRTVRGLERRWPCRCWTRCFCRRAGRKAEAAARMAFIYTPNGAYMPYWMPKKEGANFDLPACLEPMAELPQGHDRLRRATRRGPPTATGPATTPGQRVVPHRRAGAEDRRGDFSRAVRRPAGRPATRRRTRLPSLELAIEKYRGAGNCDSGYSCVYEHTSPGRTPPAGRRRSIRAGVRPPVRRPPQRPGGDRPQRAAGQRARPVRETRRTSIASWRQRQAESSTST